MGLIECASSNSIWRGVDYCERKKVISYTNHDEIIDGLVSGSYGEEYKVHVDIEHPRKSSCNCPHANGKRIICKHIIATYFTAMPEALKTFQREVEAYEEEEKRIQQRHEASLWKAARSMSKEELINELVSAWLELEDYRQYRW
ncbi:MAG: SWIM zinc finger family protein [Pseudobutyrivibrio sp.]|nr:SWIM zinc finger family protein [Pseudobutyrivibrio sp.]